VTCVVRVAWCRGRPGQAMSLFRLVEARAGCIEIDGVDIASIPLQTLRSRLGMVPQEPTLFVGTLRYNLDPWDEFDDVSIWSALEKVRRRWSLARVRGLVRSCMVELLFCCMYTIGESHACIPCANPLSVSTHMHSAHPTTPTTSVVDTAPCAWVHVYPSY
jgi:hypothetical protein